MWLNDVVTSRCLLAGQRVRWGCRGNSTANCEFRHIQLGEKLKSFRARPAPAQADAALGLRHSQCTPRLRSSRIMPKLACWTERFPYFQLITTNSVLSHVFYHNLQVSHLYDKPFHHFLIRPWDSSNTHCAQVPLYELLLELINWFIVWFMRAVREASHRSPLLEYRSDNAFETFGSLLLLSRNRSP